MTSVYPEWITRKDVESGPWDITRGTPRRGDAHTNIEQRKMRVPIGNDDMYRVVRAHEMVHSKVSPIRLYNDDRYGVAPEVLIAAHELIVNTLVKRAGFDTSLLADGSEYQSGVVLGRNKDWNNCVMSMAIMANTGGADDFIDGVRSVNPEFADMLDIVNNEITSWVDGRPTRFLSDTEPSYRFSRDEGDTPHPEGFDYTVELGSLLEAFMGRQGDELLPDRAPSRNEVEYQRNTGKFAKPIQGEVPLNGYVSGTMGRKRRVSDTGTEPRNLIRLLDDPSRRIFTRKARAAGGVVLIDTSGSMNLEHDDILKLIEQAPGATVILYSHQPRSTDVPNIWVVAHKGKVVTPGDMPYTNMGNGVDGPAVRFAAKYRKRVSDPFIWVCDGMVTDGTYDCAYNNLNRECADLVIELGIHMVDDVNEALEALKRAANGAHLPTRATGNLEDYMDADYEYFTYRDMDRDDEDSYYDDRDEDEEDYDEDDE